MENQQDLHNKDTDYGFKFNTSYLDLPHILYATVNPSPVIAPELVILNQDLAKSIGLKLTNANPNDISAIFCGNQIPNGAKPFSQAYAGHQFGHFTMLGDGRAHTLGEHILPNGERLDIQFKGSGQTPYSRRGDGRATLGPMLREYIISEAMHALGIPTTRSLAVVATGEPVMRESELPGAILTRTASSHIRVGTFEFAAANQDKELVETLLNYTIERHFPNLSNAPNKALSFLEAMMERQIDLIVNWMRVGFIHGVMNTDNMAISGETIDYGPCAFMDAYHPNTVFSSIDRMGRYAYANQPKIAQWNISRLAESLLPLFDKNMDTAIDIAKETIGSFTNNYHNKWLKMMTAKLGLATQQPKDDDLISDLLNLMETHHADYTNTFYELSQSTQPSGTFFETKTFELWHSRWQQRLANNTVSIDAAKQLMRQSNPTVIPRNHHVENALSDALSGDLTTYTKLLNILKEPYTLSDLHTHYQSPPAPSDKVYQTFCGT